ncbi:hypothetical protein NX722_07065 [Endozoicomonas gorgoniicola]|uniref:Filamentation induced by cAMP protein Fic-like C-terminal domain-containing protein n=1 Tax=Endozoicomonas gorgoniicola TaxID=1234144 RepID=A0ABT3MSQ3_9GAMM|nr:hypothetical protein [Endozoicomonas gorgoniicola]MCW7552410.1 hypothetical protein [Endozoicomonas gorgoniicola]
MAYLPVETIIRDQQGAYYQALRESDNASASTPFIAFILKAAEQALNEALESEPGHKSDQASDQVKNLLRLFISNPSEPLKVPDMMQKLALKHRPTFRKNYLKPALEQSLITMTNPDKPNSPRQSYLISTEGLSLVGK